MPLLNLEQWAPCAAIGSTLINNSVFDVRAVVPAPFETVTDPTNDLTFNQIFTGFYVGITVLEPGPLTCRLPYNFTLLAQIVSATVMN